MKVLIVAKSRMKNAVGVIAITQQGNCIRLIQSQKTSSYGEHRGFEVGDVWEIAVTRVHQMIQPHLSDFMVYKRHWLAPAKDFIGSIERLMHPRKGHPRVIYEGLLKSTSTKSGALYIAAKSGVPSYSTTFWRPDQPLACTKEGARVRFCYPSSNGGYTLRFVGFQRPLESIPAESLLCVSLAHWWRPKYKLGVESRCYAQLYGWVLDREENLARRSKSFATTALHDYNSYAAQSTKNGRMWSDGWTPDYHDYQGYEEYDGAEASLVHSLFSDDDPADSWEGPGNWE